MTTKTITRTVLGATLQTNNLLGKPHTLIKHSTLNEKFSINPPAIGSDTELLPNQKPVIQCLVIGNGGHGVTNIESGQIPFTYPKQHRSTDFALFNHIPFAMKDIMAGEDISGGTFDRNRYCLRKEISVEGVLYAVYYGRRLINVDQTNVVITHFVSENGEIISTEPFVPTSGNLSPVAPAPPNDEVVITTADYIAISAVLPILLDTDDIAELKNVANILYGNEDLAIISELGVCTGYNQSVAITTGGGTINEVLGCQIFTHVVTYHAASHVNNGLSINLELGATEPLLALSNG